MFINFLVAIAGFSLGYLSHYFLSQSLNTKRKSPRSSPLVYNLEPIYDKLCRMFDEEQIFLRPDINAKKMTKLLLTNRVYFTAALKKYGKCNFSHFLNSHRVHWSIAYFKKDPTVNVTQLGYKAGFRSPSAFNIAFKSIMNMTPGEWCRRYKINHRIGGKTGD